MPVYAWISEPLETAADPVALIDPRMIRVLTSSEAAF